MTLTTQVTQNIIRKLVNGQDYRIEIVNLINADFLQYAVEFFKKVVSAKLKGENVTDDWYRKEFIRPQLPKDEIAINSGLNVKTISNMYNTSKKEVVLEASLEHYDTLSHVISSLIDQNDDINIVLTIKFRNVSVELDLSESLIVINTLAVKRAALRGGLWSTAGKQVEKSLMKVLCLLFSVPNQFFELPHIPSSKREVDFYLVNQANKSFRCEVKLMGKGNPESADAIFARESDVFVADKLSDLNKQQATELGVEWVELRSDGGYRRFYSVLQRLSIPCNDFVGDLNKRLDDIFDEIFK